MNKRVNIYPIKGPITNVVPPIRIALTGVSKDVKDIRKCIIGGAKVEEIVGDTVVLLDLNNYDLDNGGIYTEIDNGVRVDKIEAPSKASESVISEAPIINYEFEDQEKDLLVESDISHEDDLPPAEKPVDASELVPEFEVDIPVIVPVPSEDDQYETIGVETEANSEDINVEKAPTVLTPENKVPSEKELAYIAAIEKMMKHEKLTKKERRLIREIETSKRVEDDDDVEVMDPEDM